MTEPIVLAAVAAVGLPVASALHELTHGLAAAVLAEGWTVDWRALEVHADYPDGAWRSWAVAAAPLLVGCVAGLSYWLLANGPPNAVGLALVPGYLWYTFGGWTAEFDFDDEPATRLDWGRQPSDD